MANASFKARNEAYYSAYAAAEYAADPVAARRAAVKSFRIAHFTAHYPAIAAHASYPAIVSHASYSAEYQNDWENVIIGGKTYTFNTNLVLYVLSNGKWQPTTWSQVETMLKTSGYKM